MVYFREHLFVIGDIGDNKHRPPLVHYNEDLFYLISIWIVW